MMFLAGAAASTALDLVSSLTKTLDQATKSAKAQGAFQVPGSTTATAAASSSASNSSNAIAPGTMNALLQAQGGSEASATKAGGPASRMFAFLDTDGNGAVNADELNAAIGNKATDGQKNALFTTLDADGNGSVSRDELASALTNYNRQHHHVAMSGKAPLAANVSTRA